MLSQAIPSAVSLCFVPPPWGSYNYGSESPLAFTIVLAVKCLIKWNSVYKPRSNEASPSSHSGAANVQGPSRGSIRIHFMMKYTKRVLALLSSDLVQDADPTLTYVTLKLMPPLSLDSLICKTWGLMPRYSRKRSMRTHACSQSVHLAPAAPMVSGSLERSPAFHQQTAGKEKDKRLHGRFQCPWPGSGNMDSEHLSLSKLKL